MSLPLSAARRRLSGPTSRFGVLRGLSSVACAALSSVLCAAVAAALPAAPLDLGQGLTYVRLRNLPDDFAALKAAWPAPALAIDLRYPANNGAIAMGLALAPRPTTAPLFVLVGPGTPEVAVQVLRSLAPNLITVGLRAPGVVPDIALDVKPDTDRRAYDALDAGTPLDSLIGEKPAPARFNEAALAREHENGGPDDSDRQTDLGVRSDVAPAAVPPGPTGAAAPAVEAPPPPLKDLVLERAMQMHRALLALGLLPAR